MSIQKITVIGAGTMGNGIAHVFAQSGFDVTLVDIKQEFLDKAIETIKGNLSRQVKKGTLSETDSSATISRIMSSINMEDAAKNSDFIVEAATENYELKKKIFATLDANA